MTTKLKLTSRSDKMLIFGCSDGIKKIDNIQELLKNNISIGLNRFCEFHKTDFWLWLDNPNMGDKVYRHNGIKYVPYLIFESNLDPFFDLCGSHTVASFAVDFAYKMGFKEVDLYGVLDGEYKFLDNNRVQYKHFYDENIFEFHKDNLGAWWNVITGQKLFENKIRVNIPNCTIKNVF